MLATNIPHGIVRAAEQRLWSALGNQADEFARRLSTDTEFAERLADFGLRGAYVPTASQEGARKIMGDAMFGIDDALALFDLRPSNRELELLSQVPFSDSLLESCKDSHILIAMLARPIQELARHFREVTWHNHDMDRPLRFMEPKDFPEGVSVEVCGLTRWILLRKDPVSSSPLHPYAYQIQLLGEGEGVPRAAEVAFAICAYFRKTGKLLFSLSEPDSHGVRTSSISTSTGAHAIVDIAPGKHRIVYISDGRDDDSACRYGLAGCYY